MSRRILGIGRRFASKRVKSAIFFLGIVLAASGAHGQWAFFGNDIYNTNNGRVGIGTPFPAGNLESQGSSTLEFALDAVTGNPDFSLLENGDVKSQIKYLVNGNGLSFFADDSHVGTGGLLGTPGMFLDGLTNDLTLQGTAQIRSDNQARSGSVFGVNMTGGFANGTYIEDLHSSFDSTGIALDGESAAIWSPADTGAVVSFWEEDTALAVARVNFAGVFETLSDRAAKRDIREVTGDDALSRILALDGKRYKIATSQEDLDKGGDYLERDHLGFISQELEELFPEAVTEDEATGVKYISYDMLIVPLVESIQALKAEIEALKGVEIR